MKFAVVADTNHFIDGALCKSFLRRYCTVRGMWQEAKKIIISLCDIYVGNKITVCHLL